MSLNQDRIPVKKKGKLRDKKKERTKQEILIAANKFFLKKPLNEVSVEDIAEAAFVSRTTVYNYFKNKDEIYFGLGTQFFLEINERITETLPNGLSGIEQVLALSNGVFAGSSESTLIHSIVNEFFNRLNLSNLAIEEMHDRIMDSIGTPEHEKIINSFEESYLIHFYVQLQKFEEIWREAIRNGKNDGTITNTMDDEQIVHYLFIFIEGIIEQMNLRKATLKRITLERDTIVNNSLKLISLFLKQDDNRR